MDSHLRVSELSAPPATTSVPVVRSWPLPLLREFLETVLPALLIAIATVVFVVQPTRVEGTSMEPTLHTGQRLVIEKVSYHLHPPVRGDIVVLKLEGRENTPLIKRVIGTSGDVVAIRNGHVYLNGQMVQESYLNQITVGELSSMVVPDGYLFVLGDNRGSSNDSRHFGMVPVDNVVGRAVASYWPPSDASLLK